jgi:hypothetical protein
VHLRGKGQRIELLTEADLSAVGRSARHATPMEGSLGVMSRRGGSAPDRRAAGHAAGLTGRRPGLEGTWIRLPRP